MFENIPKNWEKDKLKNILDILRNGANIKQFDNADGIPISRIETIANGYVDFNKVGYANIYDDKYKDYYIQKGDILLSHINSVAHLGKCAFCNFDSKLIHGMNLLLLRANQKILPKFLYYLLNSQILKKQLPSITKKSVNQASMSTTNLGNLNVIYPINKNEQQEIVDVLDAASEIIRLRTACIESAQSLIPALFQEMFGDLEHDTTLNTLISLEYGKALKAEDRNNDGEYPVYGSNGIVGYHDSYIVEGQTIIVGRKGSCGKLNLTQKSCYPIDTCFYIKQKINIDWTYLFYALQELNVENMLKDAVIPGINRNDYLRNKIRLASEPQQKLFAAKVQEIEAYIKTQQAELENAKTMFQSLLHYAFMGELTKYLQKSN